MGHGFNSELLVITRGYHTISSREYNHHILAKDAVFFVNMLLPLQYQNIIFSTIFSASTFAGGLDLQHGFARGFGRAHIWCLGLPCVTWAVWWGPRLFMLKNVGIQQCHFYHLFNYGDDWGDGLIILFYPHYFLFIKPDICSLKYDF